MRIFGLYIILLFACSVNAQTTVVEGRSWRYRIDNGDKIPKYFWYKIKEITNIGGIEYGKLYYSDEKTETT